MNFSRTAQHYGGLLDLTLQKARYSLRRRFSRSDEQQILRQYIDELVPKDRPRTVVDIGAGNGVRWSNSYALVLEGWNALGIEADPRKYQLLTQVYRRFPNAQACHRRVQPNDIKSLLKSFNVDKDLSVLCLDIDGNDYWILDAILSSSRPRLIVTEINEKIPPPIRFVVKYDPAFKLRHHFYGYSIAALADLCARNGYGILRLEYNNAFIAPREFAGDHFIDASAAYEQGYRNRADRKERFWLNFDVDALLSMSPEEGIQFLRQFYAKDEGNYYLGIKPEDIPIHSPQVGRTFPANRSPQISTNEQATATSPSTCNQPSCPICDSGIEPKTLGAATLGDETLFDLVECASCRTRYLCPLPSPEQLKKFYEPQYYGSDWFKQRGWGSALAQLELAKREPGNLLDVGCGLGFFIDGVRSHCKWRVFGVELAAAAVEFARAELGLEVTQAEFSELEYPDAFFDYIQLHNVLEHVRDPMKLLKECRRILKPNGALHLRVPNGMIDSRDLLKFFRDRGVPPFSKSGHLFFFPKSALVWMFAEAGLEIAEARTYGIRRGLATLGLWPRLKDWKRHYLAKPFGSNGANPQISLPPGKMRPHFYYRYRMIRMNLRMLPGMREFGLDYQFVLTPK
jgi:SAM-dependent methyltransferase